ncbi:MAG: MBL fold metallo-hydrolase [Deltaproteobacteria bacterium]|nr:MBL fold metallo-hydrolase [Deltaproteobacteria bacterium]
MKVTFWGVRGCIPAPGPDTNRFGGNTPCVTITGDSGTLVVLDAGTGITVLGRELMSGPFGKGQGRATILLSHSHWDHIQGFPFFAPVYVPGNSLTIYGLGAASSRLEDILEGQMNPHFSPIQSLRNLGATIEVHEVSDGTRFAVDDLQVSTIELPHGETSIIAFRIEEHDTSVVYAPDVGYPNGQVLDRAVAFFDKADLLIHDTTYSSEDYEGRAGRGFSSFDQAATAAVRAQVRSLSSFHYDQDYDDATVADLLIRLRRRLDELGGQSITLVEAREGLTVEP